MNPYQKIVAIFLTVAALWIFAQWFISWCKRVDASPAYDPLRDGPIDHGRNAAPAADDWEGLTLAGPVPPVSAADALPASLRTPLPYIRKSELEDAVQSQMMADTLRGTKLP